MIGGETLGALKGGNVRRALASLRRVARPCDATRIASLMTELAQAVESLQLDHEAAMRATRGAEVAVKAGEPVHRCDQVSRIRDG
jgi:hypothetical protein